jgi:hypothetical protein
MTPVEIISWLRSPEGEKWSLGYHNTLQHQGHREGTIATVEEFPEDSISWHAAYRPHDDNTIAYHVNAGDILFEPESVEGLSSPA